MPRRFTLVPHVSAVDLEQRYRSRRSPVERTRWHLLWLIAQGHVVPEATRLVVSSPDPGRARCCIAITRRGRAACGIVARRTGDGRRCWMPTKLEALRVALAASPPDGGLWASR
jgi:hypothetical protein